MSWTIDGFAWKIGEELGCEGVGKYGADDRGIFLAEFKNLGRLDQASRAVSTVLALILKSGGLYPSNTNLDVPAFISSNSGLRLSDDLYFADFVKFGETAGRANLFVYTLPTSPLADASVHFRLTGGIIYLESSGRAAWETLLDFLTDKVSAASRKRISFPKRFLALIADERSDSTDVLGMMLSAAVVDSEAVSAFAIPPSIMRHFRL